MTPSQAAHRALHLRRTLPHGQRPTDLHVRIAFALARWSNASPCHAKLARAAGCHRNSVANALRRLRGLGLLSWEPRFIRLRGGHVAQVSNAYRFNSQICPPPPVPRRGRNSSLLGRQSLCIGDRDRAADLAVLAARRAVIEATLWSHYTQGGAHAR
jgi:hypothetical protein